MLRIFFHFGHGHLVGSPEAFHAMAVHFFRAGPAFGRAEDDHRPARTVRFAGAARLFLNCANFLDASFDSRRHRLVHHLGIVTLSLDYMWRPTVSEEQMLEFFGRDAGQYRWIGDLVAVQVKNRQYRAVANRIQEFVRVPRSGQRASLRFAVSNHYANDQIWIVKGGSERMRDAVAKLAAFMDRTRNFGSAVAAKLTGERKGAEKFEHARFVLAFLRINFRIPAFEVAIRKHRRRAMTRA